MIDKQKLLQWIEDKRYVHGPPYDTVLQMTKSKAALQVLTMLEQQIELGEFEEEREASPSSPSHM